MEGLQSAKEVGGTSNWRDLNTLACARGDDWWPALFRNAYRSGDTWRVTSKSLGRDLQEDIGLHSQHGIKDFGEERPYTPIDLVAKWLPAGDACDAVDWLARRLGEDPRKYLGAKGGGETKDEAARLLDELNRDNCVVLDGGKTLVLRFEPVTYNAGGERYTYDKPAFLRFTDSRNFYLDRRVKIGEDYTMPLGSSSLAHARRRQYAGLVFSQNHLRSFAANSTCGVTGVSSRKRAIGT